MLGLQYIGSMNKIHIEVGSYLGQKCLRLWFKSEWALVFVILFHIAILVP